MSNPDGYFMEDLLVWQELDRRGFIAKGFAFDPADFRNASVSMLNEWQEKLCRMFRSLEQAVHLQIKWSVDANYREVLEYYRQQTGLLVKNDFTRLVREERYQRYWQGMIDRKLRRERLHLYLAKAITVTPDGQHDLEQDSKLLQAYANSFALHGEAFNTIAGEMAALAPMSDADHFRQLAYFLNPSFHGRFDFDPLDQFDPLKSIQENCWQSECIADKGVFKLDGYYNQLIVLKRLPKHTFPGIINGLTSLPLLDYSITVNLYPLPVQKLVDKLEKEIDALKTAYRAQGKRSILTTIQKKEQQVTELTQGYHYPFKMDFVVQAWDAELQKLQAKCGAIKAAINGMGGAQYWEVNHPITAKKLWYQTWPGWIHGSYRAHALDVSDVHAADLLPSSSTFSGHLLGAEALYEGSNRNLIGVKNFINDTPQSAVLFGDTGAGKSALLCDLLAQTEPYYAYTVIIEEGLSYGIYTQLMGERPIIIQPDGDLTLNYFDTQGLPLSSLQLATCTALVSQMAGKMADEDKQNLRSSLIYQYIDELYNAVYEDWQQSHSDLLPEIARRAYAVNQFRLKRMPVGSTYLEAWAELRDLLVANDEFASELLAKVSEENISQMLKDFSQGKIMRNTALAWFKPEDYPQHTHLYEIMRHTPMRQHDKNVVGDLASLLAPWCAGGPYGKLFDGISNLSLTGRLAHFELGYIPDAAKELKALAGFLISNHMRQHIVTLPRGLWKRKIDEEMVRRLSVPGAEKIVEEEYSGFRKYNCWNISVIQQYAKFKQSPVRPVVMGNSKQFFFLKMADLGDLEDISHDVALPEITKRAINTYPSPENLPAQNRYSSLTYLHRTGGRPVCGTVHHRASRPMLYVSSSTGADFDRRAKALKRYPSVLEGVLAESGK
ncbi:MAG: hypothetical protein LBH01_03935 [Verrucomicrobiales bacterium]|nr:hypothetical protein [Verrucomicrobiales bacterium]